VQGASSIVASENSFFLSPPETRIQVSDNLAQRDGTDTTTGIGRFEFADGTFDASMLYAAQNIGHSQAREIAQNYLAAFDRAPDAQGLYFWASKVAGGLSLDALADHFAASAEAAAQYDVDQPLTPNDLAAIAQSILNRGMDPDGLAFWTAMAEQGAVDRGSFALALIKGAYGPDQPGDSAEVIALRAADRAYLDNKIDLGLHFSAVKGLSHREKAEAVYDNWDGTQAGLAAAQALIDGFHSDAVQPGSGEMVITMVGLAGDLFDA
jgi:hypothetical protein